jgi:hypothetical protein
MNDACFLRRTSALGAPSSNRERLEPRVRIRGAKRRQHDGLRANRNGHSQRGLHRPAGSRQQMQLERDRRLTTDETSPPALAQPLVQELEERDEAYGRSGIRATRLEAEALVAASSPLTKPAAEPCCEQRDGRR